MNLNQLIELAKQHSIAPSSSPSISVPADWTQGRTVFGGLSAALVFAAIKRQVNSDRVIRSITFNFVGPLEYKLPFTIEVDVLRQGKNATQVIGKALQGGKVAVLCQACFGVARKSKINVENQQSHGMQLPKKPKFIPQIPKVTPKFLRHFDLAMDQGSLPFTGSKTSKIHGWMRLSDKDSVITEAELIGLVDAWPPTVLQLLRWPAPASTMTWNMEFIETNITYTAEDWFAYQAETRHAASGYAHSDANIWDKNGKLLVISRQTVGIFD